LKVKLSISPKQPLKYFYLQINNGSKAQIAKSGMIIRAAALRPMKEAVAFVDWQVIDAGVAFLHEAVLVEFPVFIAVRTEPFACVIIPFVGKAHGDVVACESPQFLNQPVFMFTCPFTFFVPDQLEIRACYATAVDGIGEGNFFRVSVISAVLCHADFLGRCFIGEGVKRRS
jgi:hypothetical protein